MSRKRKISVFMMKLLMWLSVGITAALVLFLVGYILFKGVPHITWELLSSKPSYLSERLGILPDILNTVYIIIATLLLVIPLGVGAAVYLTEYAKNKRLVGMIEYAAETLSGIPSIIYGLVGMLFFCQFLNMQTSLLAGALTLVIMNLPTVLRTTQESLKTVPQSYREGRDYGMYSFCRKNPRRIGGAFIHGRSCPRIIWIIRGAAKLRQYADCGAVCLCKGTGRV